MTSITDITAYTGADPSAQTTDETRGSAMGALMTYIISTFYPELKNNFIPDLNTLIGELETASNQVSQDAEQVALDKNTVVQAEANVSTMKQEVELIYDAFDDRFLGSFATAPITDNDGDPLANGMLYHNTTASAVYVYDLNTTTWIDMGLNPTAISAISGLQEALDLKQDKVANVTDTEIGYLEGATSNIQTQIDGKASTSHNHDASNITSGTINYARLPNASSSTKGASRIYTSGSNGYIYTS